MTGHVGGLPVEETLLPLMSTVSAGLVLALTWLSRLQAGRAPRRSRPRRMFSPPGSRR
jgi:hypothetical protein